VGGIRYSAAVGIDSERTGSQRLHIVAEVRGDGGDREALSALVREIVQRVHRGRGYRPARVLLVKPSTIPKTSSGKIQRARLVEMIASHEVDGQIVYESGAHRD
jgi:fatty-acyl-CoA synthase